MDFKAISLGLLGWLMTAAVAESQPQPAPTFRAGVELLTIDVSVVDDKGRPVSDLLAPEFTVTIDGEARRIVSAEFVSVGGSPTSAEASFPPTRFYSSNEGPHAGRLIVLVVDQGNIRTGAAPAVMAAAGRFLDRLTPADRVAFAAIPGPGPAVDFTTNHRLVRDALGRVAGLAHRTRGSSNLGLVEALGLEQRTDPIGRRSVMDRECGTLALGTFERERCEREVETEASVMTAEVREQTQASVRALRALLVGLQAIDGPKSLIFVSEGLIVESLGSELADLAASAAAARVGIHVLLLDVPRFDASQAQLPPTAGPDRELQVEGLEMLAGMARGAVFRIVGTADNAFDRIHSELSGHYLLAVEPTPRDRDGRRHQIRVEVRRRGTTVRARREFRFADAAATRKTDEEIVADLVQAPLLATDLPLRLASYVYRDATTTKVRVILAAEIDRGVSEPAELVIGYALVDREGRVAAAGFERKMLTPAGGPGRGPLEYAGAIVVDPGTYTVKLAAVDRAGRLGSIEHLVHAWEMSGDPIALGDLMLAGALATSGDRAAIRPRVDVRVDSGRLAAYLELYCKRPESWPGTAVDVEVAEDESGPALASGAAVLDVPQEDGRRAAQAIVPVTLLPPGRYVARAVVSVSGRTIGSLVRPFQIVPGSNDPREAATPTSSDVGADAPLAGSVSMIALGAPRFQREEILKPEILASFVDALDAVRTPSRSASLKATLARARSGRLEGTAREAFEAGDQLAATFLRGLELLAKGDLDQAANQLRASLRIAPSFFPAAFYLGACYAAGGRDRDAVGNWQPALAGSDRPAVVYRMIGDALLRLGQGMRALDPLREALGRWPDDDRLRRSLAMAYLLTARRGEALQTLEPYLLRQPGDHEALLAAIQAIYEEHAAGRAIGTPAEDRARLDRYARAYAAANGPQQPLVAKWVEFVAREKP